jgi:hypothetical protein
LCIVSVNPDTFGVHYNDQYGELHCANTHIGVDGLKAALGETVCDNNDVFLALHGMCVGFDAYRP